MQSLAHFIEELKSLAESSVGLSRDALHVHVGLSLFLAAILVVRSPRRFLIAWGVVFIVTLLGEVIDVIQDSDDYGRWNWVASVHDLLNTMVWPTILVLCLRSEKMASWLSNERGNSKDP